VQQALVVVLLVHGVARRRGRHGGGLGGVQDLIANEKKQPNSSVQVRMDGLWIGGWANLWITLYLPPTTGKTRREQTNPIRAGVRSGRGFSPLHLDSSPPGRSRGEAALRRSEGEEQAGGLTQRRGGARRRRGVRELETPAACLPRPPIRPQSARLLPSPFLSAAAR
jgi:hypothetical protein